MTTMTTQPETTAANADSIAQRKAMIVSQLRTSGVNEEFALARMMAVPREDFLPMDKQQLAYIDRSIALSNGALASPLFYGKTLIEAAPNADDRVLVVENGTAYLSALIAPLVDRVEVASAADAVEGVVSGDYTLILIDGAIERLPDIMKDALAEDGRIVSGLLLRGVTRLASGRKVAGHLALQPVEDIGIPVLPAFNAPKTWTFS